MFNKIVLCTLFVCSTGSVDVLSAGKLNGGIEHPELLTTWQVFGHSIHPPRMPNLLNYGKKSSFVRHNYLGAGYDSYDFDQKE